MSRVLRRILRVRWKTDHIRLIVTVCFSRRRADFIRIHAVLLTSFDDGRRYDGCSRTALRLFASRKIPSIGSLVVQNRHSLPHLVEIEILDAPRGAFALNENAKATVSVEPNDEKTYEGMLSVQGTYKIRAKCGNDDPVQFSVRLPLRTGKFPSSESRNPAISRGSFPPVGMGCFRRAHSAESDANTRPKRFLTSSAMLSSSGLSTTESIVWGSTMLTTTPSSVS